MGSRSGFIVKKNGVAKAYGSRWGGSSTVQWLIQGPEKATQKFINEGPLNELDDVLGGEDGHALIDWDAKVVMWSMGNCRLPVQQRLCNRMIGQAFEGWDVRQSYDLFELTEYVGGDTSEYISLDEAVPSDEEIRPDDVRVPPDPLPEFWKLGEIDDCGDWITVRGQDGTMKDYYGFGGLWNLLLLGEKLIEKLERVPSTDRIPHELVTTDGLVIDVADKVLWRWRGGRVSLMEQLLAKHWDGWTFKDVPGGGWSGQVEVTGREPGDLVCLERDILAATVLDVAPYALDDSPPGLGPIIGTARLGCVAVTLLMGLAGVGFYWLTDSIATVVVFGILFAICLYATIWLYRKTSKAIKKYSFDISPKQWNAKVDKILAGLGYPSIDELKATGELSEYEADEEDE